MCIRVPSIEKCFSISSSIMYYRIVPNFPGLVRLLLWTTPPFITYTLLAMYISSNPTQKAKELIEAHGMKCEYLPPYSPDFNPIELSFSVLKSALKYHYDTHSTRSPKEFAELIYNAAMEEVTPQVALNQFRHCKIKAGSEWYDNQWI